MKLDASYEMEGWSPRMVSRNCIREGCKAVTLFEDGVCSFHGEPGRGLPILEPQGELFGSVVDKEEVEPE